MIDVRRFVSTLFVLLILTLPAPPPVLAEDKPTATTTSAPAEPPEDLTKSETFSGLKFRGIGPALASGRISDIAVNPHNPHEWYIAVASGGVWKTTNAGTTFTPIFDDQGSYSIGCVAIDPNNPKVVWVGTGENNSQRSVAFGDGVYRTRDGGASWENMGLRDSEHIGMIAIDPRNSDVVYIAAQGPLWRAGNDRGLYKTTNGGLTWTRVLHVSDDTGINEVHLDPRNPDTIYCSAYQRRRHVWTLVNGGPESAIYKSTDAGVTWRKLTRGLPEVDLGRIGMDISPANPDVIYAIVEAAEDKGGFFRSTDRGETWEKRSDHVSGSPMYYNEIFCDPNDVDRVYSMDTFMHRTEDGGKTFSRVPRRHRHVDDHAFWIDPKNADHLLVGCDGGLYESFDRAENWGFFANLPVTQFYRVTIDNSAPFYYVYGGTQDNNTLGGPSRTLDRVGIANEHWFVTVGGDGFKSQIDPQDPNIVYSQWQYGGLVRHDRRSGETIDIKPREAPGEEPYRWNWDSPLIISVHNHARLYFAANRLFRSDDRGDSWTAISDDLTRRLDRNKLKVMGKIQPADAVAKHASTSFFGNIVSLCESPLKEGLIYVGTDDGLVQITEDAGKTWRKVDRFPGVPEMTYVSCLYASQHEPDTVYAAFDNHKNGDFKPYLLRSPDRGRNWVNVAGDLPARDIVYTVIEDHVDKNLLFAGTEFGCYFSRDGGTKWLRLKGGLPTIAVRDIAIHARENDLVLATFGRGFYILDDYSPLRESTPELLAADAHLFPVEPALRYIRTNRLGNRSGRGSQGANFYAAPNPPFGAVFTYYFKEKIMTRKERRKQEEKKAAKEGRDAPYPTIEQLREEDLEKEPAVVLIVRDGQGRVLRRIAGDRDKGFHRVSWDLRYPTAEPISLAKPEEPAPWDEDPAGPLASPGAYTVTLAKEVDGVVTPLVEPRTFEVQSLDLATFPAKDAAELLAFKQKLSRLQRAVLAAVRAAGEAGNRLKHCRKAVLETPDVDPALLADVTALERRLEALLTKLRGDPTRAKRNEPEPPSIQERVQNATYSLWYSTSPPTKTQRDAYRFAGEEFRPVLDDLRQLVEKDLAQLEQKLEQANAPWTPGRLPTWEFEGE
ncbi:MAG: glycosyl hydrolase [Phycisphaerae bacterium]|nr:glycosyl hydrolase [Phycisphaerae bacterium]